jgi:hypothetical protein
VQVDFSSPLCFLVTTQVDRLKVDRLKEKTCAITQSQDRLDTLAGDCVMDDHYCPSVFSLQPKHLSSYVFYTTVRGGNQNTL